jgi:hypothetical protein
MPNERLKDGSSISRNAFFPPVNVHRADERDGFVRATDARKEVVVSTLPLTHLLRGVSIYCRAEAGRRDRETCRSEGGAERGYRLLHQVFESQNANQIGLPLVRSDPAFCVLLPRAVTADVTCAEWA